MIHRRQQPGAAGFSLIEVMVATAVLLVVVLMVGAVFRQASSSWDSGYARAEGGMIVRGVLGSIQRELSQAVDGRQFEPAWTHDGVPVYVSGGTLEFVRPHFDQETKEERYLLVTYTAGSGSVKRSSKKLKWNAPSREWPQGSWSTEEAGDKPADVYNQSGNAAFTADFQFDADEVPDPGVGLDEQGRPKKGVFWTVPTVSLRVELHRTGAFSGLTVLSYGRDGKKGTDDDIEVR